LCLPDFFLDVFKRGEVVLVKFLAHDEKLGDVICLFRMRRGKVENQAGRASK